MSPRNVTYAMVAALLGLVGVDVAAQWTASRADQPLPSVGPFTVESIAKIEIQRGDATIDLEPGVTGWTLDGAPADAPSIEALLGPFEERVTMDVRVADGGDLEPFGLQGGREISVTFEAPGGADLLAMWVGDDAPGGTTYVRLADDDQVYRARIGGRSIYDRTAGAWRDRRVVGLEPEAIDGLWIESSAGSVGFLRTDAGWVREGDPSFAVDQATVDAAVKVLATMRGGEVLTNEPVAPIAARVRLRTAEGEKLVRVLKDGTDTVAVVDGRALRVAPQLAESLQIPDLAWKDRTLLRFDPNEARRIRLQGDATVVIERGPDGAWQADAGAVQAALAELANLRADGLVPEPPADLVFAEGVWIGLASGEVGIEVGGSAGRGIRYVRTAAGVAVLREDTWNRIRSGLGG